MSETEIEFIKRTLNFYWGEWNKAHPDNLDDFETSKSIVKKLDIPHIVVPACPKCGDTGRCDPTLGEPDVRECDRKHKSSNVSE